LLLFRYTYFRITVQTYIDDWFNGVCQALNKRAFQLLDLIMTVS